MFEARNTPPEKGGSVFAFPKERASEYDIRCAYHPKRASREFLQDGRPACGECWYVLEKA